MTECNCDCHKKNAEINQLKRKLLIATVAIAVGGTFVGKEAFDGMLEYFQKYDKVKQAIDKVTINGDKYEMSDTVYYGVSPSPGTLAIFGLYTLMPTRRRR